MGTLENLLWVLVILVFLWILNSYSSLIGRRRRASNARELEMVLGEGVHINYKAKDCHDCRFCKALVSNRKVDLWCRHEVASKGNLGYPIEKECRYWLPMRKQTDLTEAELAHDESYIIVNEG